jgi:predicted nucleic acid-binding protein
MPGPIFVGTLLFRREAFDEAVRFMEGIFAAAEQGHLTIERITSEHFSAAWRLRQRFKDKTCISFTDLTSMAVMEERGLNDILTEDEHFMLFETVYIYVIKIRMF